MNRIINPDSTVLQQVDGQWQKLATLILWKLAGRKRVRITAAEIQALWESFEPGEPVLATFGNADSIEFEIVDQASANRLAAHDETQRGSA